MIRKPLCWIGAHKWRSMQYDSSKGLHQQCRYCSKGRWIDGA